MGPTCHFFYGMISNLVKTILWIPYTSHACTPPPGQRRSQVSLAGGGLTEFQGGINLSIPIVTAKGTMQPRGAQISPPPVATGLPHDLPMFSVKVRVTQPLESALINSV